MPDHSPSLRFSHGTVEAETSIHYAEAGGDGSPLVLLHGIGMDWRVWQAMSRRIASHHLYLIDLRGHGQSGKPPHGYSLAHYAADVEDLLDALGIAGATLVGSSLGAMVAVVVEAPLDVVAGRVLVDPPFTGGPLRDAGMLETIFRLKHESREALAAYLSSINPGIGRFLADTMAEMWRVSADGVIQDALEGRDSYFSVDGSLAATESPTLIMQADRALGGVLTDRQAQHALDLLPRGRLLPMPGAGHAIHATRPVEFAGALLNFLAHDIPPGAEGGGHILQ